MTPSQRSRAFCGPIGAEVSNFRKNAYDATMKSLCVWCVVTMLVCGCKSSQDSSEVSAVVGGAPAPETTGMRALPEEPPTGEEPEAAQPIGGNAEAAEPPADQPAASARDLAAELRVAVGNPVDCLQDYRPSSTTVIQIAISAIVRPSGLVVEPSCSGSGLSANDRSCIEQRVGDVVLAPLGTQASQPVSTSIDLDLERPTAKEHDVGAPAPKLEDVVEPLPKKETIAPSGVPIEKAPSDAIDGPRGVPIDGPRGVPVEGPKPEPIDGYQVDERSERWTK